jgi:hypothetical protein
MNNKTLTILLTSAILVLVVGVVASNYAQERAIDQSKIPEKMENGKEFQRWITNLKKHMDLEADEFRLKEKNEVFNSAYLSIVSVEDEDAYNNHLALLAQYEDLDKVRFSPNEYQFLDYRHEVRGINTRGEPYQPNNVYYHALREDKIFDTLILSCREDANCFFDRGFFLDNHTFVISEFARPIEKKDLEEGNYEECLLDEVCTYTIKLHMFDLLNSARLVYESNEYELDLSSLVDRF